VFLWLWLGYMNVESKDLVMPTTIFSPVKPTREFAPLSQEHSHMCRWQVTPVGGPIAIAPPSPPTHMHTHVRSTCNAIGIAPALQTTVRPGSMASTPRRLGTTVGLPAYADGTRTSADAHIHRRTYADGGRRHRLPQRPLGSKPMSSGHRCIQLFL
jgi:hypothetical protein